MARAVNGFRAMKMPKDTQWTRRHSPGWAEKTVMAFAESGKETWGKEYEDLDELVRDRNTLAMWIGRHPTECEGIRLLKRGKRLYLVREPEEDEDAEE